MLYRSVHDGTMTIIGSSETIHLAEVSVGWRGLPGYGSVFSRFVESKICTRLRAMKIQTA